MYTKNVASASEDRGRWSVRLRALNSPREAPASPARPLVCRASNELSVCWQIERSPESGGALEAAVGWWYWVEVGWVQLCVLVKYMHTRDSTVGVPGTGGGCRFSHSAHVDVREQREPASHHAQHGLGDLPADPLIPLALHCPG